MYSFNITILGEGHPLSPGWQGPGRYFNPPSPCGEGPGGQRLRRVQRHFNPPSPCGEGRHRKRYDLQHHSISIHPPRVGRDSSAPCYNKHGSLISIHPPRVGRDTPTLLGLSYALDFNPPSPCGEGLPGGGLGTCIVVFQSTLPVWGGTSSIRNCRRTSAFQSTLPVWGGTISTGQLLLDTIISIHPPRVGRDSKSSQKFFVNFCARR